MMKAKISPNIISFITVRRGEWILKVSVFKNKQIMVIAHHCFEVDKLIIKCFTNQHAAADFIEHLVMEN